MEKLITCSVVALIAIAAEFFMAWLLMLGWNFIAPLFHGPQITFWHALVGMIVLSIIGSAFKK